MYQTIRTASRDQGTILPDHVLNELGAAILSFYEKLEGKGQLE